MGWFKNASIVQAWLVILLALCFGVALAGIQTTLGPVILQNKINETLEKAPVLVLGKAMAEKMAAQDQKLEIIPRVLKVETAGQKKFYTIYETRYQKSLKGWVVKVSGAGYADKIEMLLGLDPEGKTISGLFVMDQKETPGLGNKIVNEKWRNQFVDKKTGTPLVVVKTKAAAPNEIDAVTGATISSNSVADIINTAVQDIGSRLVTLTGDNRKKGS